MILVRIVNDSMINKRIIMDNKEEIVLVCSQCGRKEEYSIVHRIEPVQKEKVKDMSIFQWKCPQCGKVQKLVYPCFYVDKDKKIIVLLQGQGVETMLDESDWKLDGYTKRICRTIEEFSEKIRVLDLRLQDKIIEILKLLLFAQIHLKEPELTDIFFYQIAEDGSFEFTIRKGDRPDGIAVSGKIYEELCETIPEYIDEEEIGFCCIDLDWAGSQIVKDRIQ